MKGKRREEGHQFEEKGREEGRKHEKEIGRRKEQCK